METGGAALTGHYRKDIASDETVCRDCEEKEARMGAVCRSGEDSPIGYPIPHEQSRCSPGSSPARPAGTPPDRPYN